MNAAHQAWMAEALRQANRGLYTTHPNPRVGCVIVHQDEQIASGWHEFAGGPHAEANALRAAEIPVGADFYITLEPCSHHGRTPPCVDAVIEARPARVIVAMQDPNPEISGRGLEKLRVQTIEVVTGILENEARELNRGFVKRMEQGLPYVSVKMATSLDGRTALANGESQWITGEAARRDVQFQRARASAILSSAQTVIDDDPSLNVRLTSEALGQRRTVHQPVRVVVDSQGRLTGQERIFSIDGDIWVYSLNAESYGAKRLRDAGAQVIAVQAEGEHISLNAMLRDLATRGINEVHSECGAELSGALIQQGVVDQIILYQAPHLLGNRARGAFDLGEIESMTQRKNCKIQDMRQLGDDLRLTLRLE